MRKIPEPRSVSLWRHYYDREKTADQLSASMIEWQTKWNWDFLKINPAACYHVLDWGAEYQFFEDPSREPQLVKPLIETASDVDRVSRVDVTQGALGDQLQVIRNLRQHFGPELLMYQTIFVPMEIAHRLMTGREALMQMQHTDPRALHRLLRVISEVFGDFASQCISAGANGIFFATKWANSDSMTWADYQEFGKQYEIPILDTIRKAGGAVILHVCGGHTYLRQMYDYPVDVISYDFFAAGSPLPQQAIERADKPILGGIDPDRAVHDMESVLDDCRIYLNLPRWIAGPSCVLPADISDETVDRLNRGLRSILSC